jgi:hypothetical protein
VRRLLCCHPVNRTAAIATALLLIRLAPGAEPSAQTVPAPAPAAPPAAPAQPAIAPIVDVPDEVSQERVAKELRALYKAEYASRKSDERIQFARKLLEQGRAPGEAVSRFVMLSESADLSARLGETDLAMAAVDALLAGFRLDAAPERLRCLAALVPNLGSIAQASAAIACASQLADAAVQRDDYATAGKAVAVLEQAARRTRDPGLLAQAKAQSEQVKTLAEAWRELGEVEDPLGGITPGGHARLGRFYALVKGDWAAALPHLAAGDDALRSAAAAELAATSPPLQLAAADGWYELAGKERSTAKQQLLLHSASLYRLALDGLGGLERARADKRIADIDRQVPGTFRINPRRPPGAALYFSFERDALGVDGGRPVALDSSGHGIKGRITAARAVSGAFGTAVEFGPEQGSIDCGNPSGLAITGSMSIAMWLKPAVVTQRRNPFYKSYGSEGAITIETGGALTYFYGAVGADEDPYQGFGSGSVLVPQTWTHVVLVRDLGPAKQLAWHFNGKRTNVVAATYPESKASPKPVMLGNGYTGFPYVGVIDEVGIWPRALGEDEIKLLYESTAIGR